MEVTRVVILGGGFGGLIAARRLSHSRRAKRLDVTVVDASKTHVYAPWLYELATSCLTSRSSSQEWHEAKTSLNFSFARLRGYPGVRFRCARVANIDEQSRHVLFDDGTTMPYDKLIIALGAVPNYFGIDGLAHACIPLKTLEDGLRIRERIMAAIAKRPAARPLSVVVGGAGANGTEFASELAVTVRAAVQRGLLAQNAVAITLIDAAPRVLMQLPEAMSLCAQRRLASLGVRVELGKAMSTVSSGRVHLGDGANALPFDLCIWSGGITVSDVVRALPFPKDPKGRLLVDKHLRVGGRDDVFAIGDCASLQNPRTHSADPQSAPVAIAQAEIAARNILASLAHRPLVAFPFRASWPILVTLGGKYALGMIYGVRMSGYAAFLLRRLIDLGYFLRVLTFGDAWRFWLRGVAIYAKNEDGD